MIPDVFRNVSSHSWLLVIYAIDMIVELSLFKEGTWV